MNPLRSQRAVMKFGVAFAMLAVFHAAAQEPDNRGGNRANSTREFLGLGSAPDAAAAKKGVPLFTANCAGCHGANARGAQGPNLVRSVVVLHDEKGEEIGPVIRNGRPQAGMPAFPQLSNDDIYALSQFLKLQIELTANRGTYGQTYKNLRAQPTGDAAKGQEFFTANCVTCHSAAGDLAKIGAKFSDAATMQSHFIWPVSKGVPHAAVTTKDGSIVSGAIAHIDDFDVALTSPDGTYHDWPRDEVQVKLDDKLTGHRELLPKYTDANLHDVTAYLLTLK